MTVVLAAALLLGVPVAAAGWALARLAETRLAAPELRVALWTAVLAAAPVLLASAVVPSALPADLSPPPAATMTLDAVSVEFGPVAAREEAFTFGPERLALALLSVLALGVALALFHLALRARRLTRLLSQASSPVLACRQAVAAVAARLHVRAPRVLRSSHVAEPMLAGLLRPVLLLPADTAPIDRRVLAHELAHLKRGDHVALWAEALLVALLWFNPFVRFASRRAAVAREEACDAIALRGATPDERRLYARTLVDTLRPAAGPPLAIPFGGQGRSPAMRRLDAVLKPAARPRLTERLSTLGLAAAVTGAAVAAAGAQPRSGQGVEADVATLGSPAGRMIIQLSERLGDDPYIIRAASQPSGAVCVIAGPGPLSGGPAATAQPFISYPDRLLSAQDTSNFAALVQSTCPGFLTATAGTRAPEPALPLRSPADLSALQFRYDPQACVAYFVGEARMAQGDRSWAADQIQGHYERAGSGECGPQLTQVRLMGSVRVDGRVPASGPDELVLRMAASPTPAAATVRLPSPTRVSLDGRPLARGELERVEPASVRGVEVNTGTGEVAMQTAAADPAPASEGPPRATNPRWTRRPTGADIACAYPAEAARRGVSGSSAIDCAIGASGEMNDCRVVSESPAGEGFGAAGLQLAESFTADTGPQSPSGSRVRIPVRWNLTTPQSGGTEASR